MQSSVIYNFHVFNCDKCINWIIGDSKSYVSQVKGKSIKVVGCRQFISTRIGVK